eukprot:scaffold1084_cov38-Cylindrotheca_fusiformis.AAC.1
MEETDLHRPLLLESQGDAVVEGASPEEEDEQRGAPTRKVWFGLIALLAIASTAVVVFHLFYASPDECRSRMELIAPVVLPTGVEVSDLHWTAAPQYRALEWLACKDPRHNNMTIDDDATELLERFSLVTFYYSVGGGDSLRESYWSGWLKNSSHCEWDYIKCDEDGRVSTLCPIPEASSGNMHGTLPTEIGNFKGLRHLRLAGNGEDELMGPIPSEIGHLQQLTSLEIFYNKFSGPIPSEIGHLQQLKSLELGLNTFSGPIPSEIGHLQQLKSLDLGLNTFSGPIPSEIGHLQQLESLRLYQNKLSGPIPSEIGNLQQLKSLELGLNTFSGPIPSEIGNLQKLQDLVLYSNELSGPIPSEIGNLQQLLYLALQGNIGLTGTVPVEVGQLESIKEASFFKTSLTGGLDDLAFCKNRISLQANCGGLNPKITCECCTTCCLTNKNGQLVCGV